MSITSPLPTVLRTALTHPTRGIAGVVDDLLAACRESGLQLDWQTDRCRVRSGGGDAEELVDVPLRRSVFRAILARVAALCNERSPNSVSPYGGQTELSLGANPARVVRVTFTNTPDEQRLELSQVQPRPATHSAGPDGAAPPGSGPGAKPAAGISPSTG